MPGRDIQRAGESPLNARSAHITSVAPAAAAGCQVMLRLLDTWSAGLCDWALVKAAAAADAFVLRRSAAAATTEQKAPHVYSRDPNA